MKSSIVKFMFLMNKLWKVCMTAGRLYMSAKCHSGAEHWVHFSVGLESVKSRIKLKDNGWGRIWACYIFFCDSHCMVRYKHLIHYWLMSLILIPPAFLCSFHSLIFLFLWKYSDVGTYLISVMFYCMFGSARSV